MDEPRSWFVVAVSAAMAFVAVWSCRAPGPEEDGEWRCPPEWILDMPNEPPKNWPGDD